MFILLEIVQTPIGLGTFTQPCKRTQLTQEARRILFHLIFLLLLLFAFAVSWTPLFGRAQSYKESLFNPHLQGSRSQHFIPWSQKATKLDTSHGICSQFSIYSNINTTSCFPSLWSGNKLREPFLRIQSTFWGHQFSLLMVLPQLLSQPPPYLSLFILLR